MRVPHPHALTRGQSSVDFVVGFAVFFIVLSFILVAVPELLSPFGESEGPVVADRALTSLTDNLLATSGSVSGVNASCTQDFFAGTNASCGFDGDKATTELLGISGTYQVNITVKRNLTTTPETAVVCYDGSVTACGGSGSTRLARGPPPAGETTTVQSASRVARLSDKAVFIELRVW
jgi:hypothetical protein